ncbi:ABC transporter substrate-binding protein [Clostridium polynesiense]|uniref:ABC transporter substrate-binding protein n=1 Tax=Clostridium polynesiense TaxID=1325933 RepID=UPI00058B5D6A|nr:ABC transporter substrate-binding protein [Clostridium polynesiense]
MKKKRLFTLMATSLMLAVTMLTGCGGGGETSDANVSAKPQVGGNLVVGLTGDPYNLAPWTNNDMNASTVMDSVLPKLMTTDEKGNKVPYIIKEYSANEDSTVFTVTIHDGLSWHDGKPFTTEDLAFTAKYTVDKKLGYGADMYAPVEKTEIVDKTTIKYHLKDTTINFLTQAGYWVPIMPKHIYEKVDDPMNYKFEGLGYGPYKVKEYKKGEYYTLERVPDWPLANGGKGGYLETVTFRIFPDANALTLAIKNGEVNVSGSALPVSAQKQLEASSDRFGVIKTDSLGYGYFSFNYKNELLKDVNVRKAIAQTVDKDAICTTAMQGGARKMEGPISPVYADLNKSGIKFPEFSIEDAKKTLEDAGYKDSDNDGIREKDGKNLEFELIYRTTTMNVDSIANIFKSNAEKAGIKINLKPVDPATYTDKVVKQKNFDMNVIEWGVIDDPDTSLSTVYHSKSDLNIMCYKNEKMDQLLEASTKETDYEKRIKIMDEFQKEFVKEIPALNSWVKTNAYGYSKEFAGFELTPGLVGLMESKNIVKVYKAK